MKKVIISNLKKQMSLIIDEIELNERNYKKFNSLPDPLGMRKKSYQLALKNLEDEYLKLQEELFKLMRD